MTSGDARFVAELPDRQVDDLFSVGALSVGALHVPSTPMVLVDATYALEMGFTPRSRAFPDPDRPPLLRAPTRTTGTYGDEGIEVHRCDAVDLVGDGSGGSGEDSRKVDLFEFGFDRVDLTDHAELQRVLSDVRRRGRITDSDASAIRAAFAGAVLRCSGGRTLTVLHVADEGLIMRTAGPNRLTLAADQSQDMNGHGPATSVHTDQDVHGTPMLQLMDGRAPAMFRHDSPDGSNHDASLMLVNVWIPLQQVVQPLVLADGRSVDRLADQMRYGLPTDSFLDRDEDQVVNDIWTYAHHPDHRWYFSSEMDHRNAYVFDTLSCPHGAGTLAGEDVAERCYRALEAAEAAVERDDGFADEIAYVRVAEQRERTQFAELGSPPALRAAITDMVELLDRLDTVADADADAAAAWVAASRAARGRVERRSLEMRVVVSTGA